MKRLLRWLLRRPEPGFVRISQKKLIELQRTALHVMELEKEIAANEHATRVLEAESAARSILRDLPSHCEPGVDEARDALLQDLPLHEDGTLHRQAFLLLVDDATWRQRESARLVLLSTHREA